LDINANHIRSAHKGWVYGKATPYHLGKTTQVWEIKITDDEGKLCCINRLTMSVIPKPNTPSNNYIQMQAFALFKLPQSDKTDFVKGKIKVMKMKLYFTDTQTRFVISPFAHQNKAFGLCLMN
jgi:hypothetical protein